MFDKLEDVVLRYYEIESRLSDPGLISRPEEFKKLSVEHSSLAPIVSEYSKYKTLKKTISDSKQIIADSDRSDGLHEFHNEMTKLAKEEVRLSEEEIQRVTRNLQILLLPKDPRDQKNVILEVRAGAGGDEASLFAMELFRAYQRYSEKRGWRFELLSANSTGLGGVKEIIAQIEGEQVFSKLKWEAGVHRVQRVPETEAQGRVHTSTVTVAVMPEAEDVDVTVSPVDLRIDVFRSGGAGGQGVNTTDSAVRITHIPSGLVVVCQDERSQIKNKDKAMKILRSRLLDQEIQKAAESNAQQRKGMVGTGDRSERIRTYNFPQGRLTDHRIGLTLYQLPDIMEGKMDELIESLISYFQAIVLKEQGLS